MSTTTAPDHGSWRRSLAPRAAGYAEVLARRAAPAYGGAGRFLAGALIEAVFNFLLYGITLVRLSVFMAGLALAGGRPCRRLERRDQRLLRPRWQRPR